MVEKPTGPNRPPPGRSASGRPGAKGAAGGDRSAFDVWLDRGLHRMFDEVAQEPIPDELLKLIEGDRDKGS